MHFQECLNICHQETARTASQVGIVNWSSFNRLRYPEENGISAVEKDCAAQGFSGTEGEESLVAAVKRRIFQLLATYWVR